MREDLIINFLTIRDFSKALCSNLHTEDYVIQGMEDVSPPKWHLAHTTWFFETFILKNLSGYSVFHPDFHTLFNSYYQGIGKPFPRAMRGLLSRPLVHEIYNYRDYVDEHIVKLLNNCASKETTKLHSITTLGLEHEQQHQELLLMDIKYNFSLNPYFPAYHEQKEQFSEKEVG